MAVESQTHVVGSGASDVASSDSGETTGFAHWSGPAPSLGLPTPGDGQMATANLSGTSTVTTHLTMLFPGFTIPRDAAIVGVLLELDRQASGANVTDNGLQLVVKGSGSTYTPVGTSKSGPGAWATALSAVDVGASNDPWGASLTVADVNAGKLGVKLQARLVGSTPRTASIDYAQLTVYYRVPPRLRLVI